MTSRGVEGVTCGSWSSPGPPSAGQTWGRSRRPQGFTAGQERGVPEEVGIKGLGSRRGGPVGQVRSGCVVVSGPQFRLTWVVRTLSSPLSHGSAHLRRSRVDSSSSSDPSGDPGLDGPRTRKLSPNLLDEFRSDQPPPPRHPHFSYGVRAVTRYSGTTRSDAQPWTQIRKPLWEEANPVTSTPGVPGPPGVPLPSRVGWCPVSTRRLQRFPILTPIPVPPV